MDGKNEVVKCPLILIPVNPSSSLINIFNDSYFMIKNILIVKMVQTHKNHVFVLFLDLGQSVPYLFIVLTS